MSEIKRISNRDDLVALANKLGVRPDWHEPGEQGVTADVSGAYFDNAGFWGEAELALSTLPTSALELWVTLSRDGKAVAEVNLATLFAFATGFEG
jgi:hypothetical protein